MTYSSLTPQKIMITVAVIFLVSYGLFNSRFILKGPEIAVAGLDSSNDVIKTDSRDFSLQGKAVHSSYISVNDRPILVDEFGNFNEKLLLSNGISIIDIYARDKFGKEVRKKIDVVYTGESSSLALEKDLTALRSSSLASSSDDVIEEESEDNDENENQTINP